MKQLLVALSASLLGITASAQQITPEQYIEQYKDLAIKEMVRMGVPASITLAQGLLETEAGNSKLLKKSNNHFGIKCKSSWSGEGVSHDDDAIGECFRTYKTAEESYRDHSNFLRGSDRYRFLFDLDPADYKGWAYGLKKAGYATNPKYPVILIQNIERYNLQQYTLVALKDVQKVDRSQFQDDPEVPFVYVEEPEKPAAKPAAGNSSGNAVVIEGSDRTSVINGSKCVLAPKGTSLLAIATRQDISLARLLQYNDLTEDGILAKDQPVFIEKKGTENLTGTYTVQKGQTLQEVSQQAGIQLDYLAQYNGISRNTVVKEGTVLNLRPRQKYPDPAVEKPVATPAPALKYHTVQAKEGLYSIAKKYGVTVQQLKEWNHLDSDALSIGQQLVVSR